MKRARGSKSQWSNALVLLFTVVTVSCAQQQEDPSNAMCVTRLQVPVYPAIAQSARVSVSLTAAIAVAPDGSTQSIIRPNSAHRVWRGGNGDNQSVRDR
jgi:hypothetical protein